jgi:hypothetical protein
MRQMKFLALMVAAIFSIAISRPASAVLWSNSSGTSPGLFSWSNGGSDQGLFGDPVVVGNQFIFSPANFRAVSNNGVAVTTADRLFVTIDVAPGNTLQEVRFSEFGDYSILGTGTVQAAGFMFVTNLSNGNVQSGVMTTTPVFPISTTSSAFGLWSGLITVPLPNGATRVTIIINNILQAISGANSTAYIEKKNAGLVLDIVIPEPASLSMLALGGLLLGRRRRV